MRKHIAIFAMAAGLLSLAAAPALATTFTGSYTESHNATDPGLVIQTVDLTPGAGTGFSFDLNSVGDIAVVSLFDIYTNEASVDGDDLLPKPITVGFNFTAPELFGGSVGGWTGGFSLLGIIQNGYVTWDNGGNTLINFGNGGQLGLHMDNGMFNQGVFGIDEGFSERATVTGQFTLNSAAVPEPATWAMMIMGFAGMGAVLRRRRHPAFA